jgi:prophage regulatory protein
MSNQQNFSALPPTGFVRQAQLVPAIIPFSSATLWRKVRDGSFPAPVKLSERVTAWEVSAIREWMQARLPLKAD